MNKKLVVAAVLVAAGATAGVVVFARGRGRTPHHVHVDTTSVRATGFDQADASVSFEAMLNAPEKATPCETAYAAIQAEQQVTKLRGTHSMFEWVAPEADFLASCRALTEAQQQCMAPRYRHDHRDDCDRARPSPDTLAKMIRGVPVPEPTIQNP
jgi:hypothetical protein